MQKSKPFIYKTEEQRKMYFFNTDARSIRNKRDFFKAHCLPPEVLKKREVVIIDIANDAIPAAVITYKHQESNSKSNFAYFKGLQGTRRPNQVPISKDRAWSADKRLANNLPATSHVLLQISHRALQMVRPAGPNREIYPRCEQLFDLF